MLGQEGAQSPEIPGRHAVGPDCVRKHALVVSDGVMPILDGYQFCRILKDDPSTRHIPVILLTGQAVGLSRVGEGSTFQVWFPLVGPASSAATAEMG